MQRRSMLYEKVVNIEANYTAALHWIAIDTGPCVFGMKGKWLQEWIQKCWQPYKTTFASTGRLVTCTKKVQWDTVIFHCRLIDVITFMWQTKHLEEKLYFSLMFLCQCQRNNKRNTHTQKQTDRSTHTLTVRIKFRDEFLFLMFDFDLLYSMCTAERMSSTLFFLFDLLPVLTSNKIVSSWTWDWKVAKVSWSLNQKKKTFKLNAFKVNTLLFYSLQ